MQRTSPTPTQITRDWWHSSWLRAVLAFVFPMRAMAIDMALGQQSAWEDAISIADSIADEIADLRVDIRDGVNTAVAMRSSQSVTINMADVVAQATAEAVQAALADYRGRPVNTAVPRVPEQTEQTEQSLDKPPTPAQQRVIEFLRTNPNASAREVSAAIGVGAGTYYRAMERIQNEHQNVTK